MAWSRHVYAAYDVLTAADLNSNMAVLDSSIYALATAANNGYAGFSNGLNSVALYPATRHLGVIGRGSEVANTTTETDLFTAVSVPANLLSTDQALVIDFLAQVWNSTGGNKNLAIAVYYGAGTGTVYTYVIGTGSYWQIVWGKIYIVANGATNAQYAYGVSFKGTDQGSASAGITADLTMAIDSTAIQTTKITFAMATPASANFKFRRLHSMVSLLRSS